MVEKRVKNIRKTLERFRQRLQEKIRVHQIILFGSYARGTPRDYSDIDVAVISPDFRGGGKADYLLLGRAAREVTPLIEAFAYTPTDLQRRQPGDFLDHIVTTGKMIFSV